MDIETYATRLAARVVALEEKLIERDSLIVLMAVAAGGSIEISGEHQDMAHEIEGASWNLGEDGVIRVVVRRREASTREA